MEVLHLSYLLMAPWSSCTFASRKEVLSCKKAAFRVSNLQISFVCTLPASAKSVISLPCENSNATAIEFLCYTAVNRLGTRQNTDYKFAAAKMRCV